MIVFLSVRSSTSIFSDVFINSKDVFVIISEELCTVPKAPSSNVFAEHATSNTRIKKEDFLIVQS
jgi:hypothetical protein